MSRHTFEAYAPGYRDLWAHLQIRSYRAADVEASARRILAGRERYQVVSQLTGVPWYVVGIIHKMECSHFPRFDQHLHNGDPLTRRTRLVPAGRPAAGSPPFTWEESAADALLLKKFDKVERWTIERIAYALELYNGWGYRKFGIPSPYLWSFTTAYTSGKYVADHVWSASAVSTQSGAMALLAMLMRLDTSIRPPLGSEAMEFEPTDERERLPRTPSAVKLLLRSRTLGGTILAGLGWLVTKAADVIGSPVELLTDIATEAGGMAEAVSRVAELAGITVAGLGAAAILYGLAVVVHARVSAQIKGKVA